MTEQTLLIALAAVKMPILEWRWQGPPNAYAIVRTPFVCFCRANRKYPIYQWAWFLCWAETTKNKTLQRNVNTKRYHRPHQQSLFLALRGKLVTRKTEAGAQ